MGFFDFTALAGPVPDQNLPFVPQVSLWVAIVGMLVASALGILKASIGSLRPRRIAVPAAARVAPASSLALAPSAARRQPGVRTLGSPSQMR